MVEWELSEAHSPGDGTIRRSLEYIASTLGSMGCPAIRVSLPHVIVDPTGIGVDVIEAIANATDLELEGQPPKIDDIGEGLVGHAMSWAPIIKRLHQQVQSLWSARSRIRLIEPARDGADALSQTQYRIVLQRPNILAENESARAQVEAVILAMFEALGDDPSIECLAVGQASHAHYYDTLAYEVETEATVADGHANITLTLRHGVSNQRIPVGPLTIHQRRWISDALRVETDMVSKIIEALNEHRSKFASHTASPLDVYLKCEAAINGFQTARWNDVERDLKRLMRELPAWAAVRASLSNMQNSVHFTTAGLMRSAARSLESLAMSQAAVDLAPAHGRCQLAHAHSCMLTGQHEEALKAFHLAIQQMPSDTRVLVSGGCGLAVCGRPNDGIVLLDYALSRMSQPKPQHEFYYGLVLFLLGRDKEAVEHFELAKEGMPFCPGFLAAAHAKAGQVDGARDAWAVAVRRASSNWIIGSPFTEAALAAWYLHLVPFAKQEHWELLRDGLRIAGAPVDQCRFDTW
jgi:tetratricopeptide (TPR) repeat protein